MAAGSGTESHPALSPVPCIPLQPGHSLGPSRAVTAPWSAQVLLEPHLPGNTENCPAWPGLGAICGLFNRPGLGLALLQYECADIYCDKPRLYKYTSPQTQLHNYKCWVNPKACLSLYKSTPVVAFKIILSAIHMPTSILSFCFQPWGCPDCSFVLLRPLHYSH